MRKSCTVSATQFASLWNLHCHALDGREEMLILEQDIAAIAGTILVLDGRIWLLTVFDGRLVERD